MDALVVFIVAFFIALLATPACRWLALRTGAVAIPGERSVHREPMPYLGGLAIAAGFAGAVLVAGRGDFPWFTVLSGGLFILLLGIVDDVVSLRPWVKLLGQLVGAAVLYFGGVQVGYITNPLGGLFLLGWLALPITLAWVVGVINVVNLSDGLDGLAAGISSIAGLTLLYVAWQQGQPGVALAAAALSGSTLGFLPYNFNPARIFMGDGGSMFIGYVLAAIAMQGTLKSTAAIALLIPFLALGLPMFDAFFSVLRRAANGRPIYEADGGHLHHRLLRLGMTQRQVVISMYMGSLLLGSSAALMTALDPRHGGLLMITVVGLMIAIGKKVGILEIKQEKDIKH